MNSTHQKRIVCFIDILGFSEMVKSSSNEEIIEKFYSVFTTILNSDLLERQKITSRNITSSMLSEAGQILSSMEDAKKIRNNKGKIDLKSNLDKIHQQISNFNFMIISDSIIIYTNPICENDDILSVFDEFCSYIKSFFVQSFYQKVKLRGAMSYGDFYVDLNNSIYFGNALIESYKFESKQEWIGCSLCESLDDIGLKFFERNTLKKGIEPKDMPIGSFRKKIGNLIIPYNVPLKENKTQNRYIINWYSGLMGKIELSRNFFDEQLTGNPLIDIKYTNTMNYMYWYENTIIEKLGINK